VNDGLFVDKSYHSIVKGNTVNGKHLIYLEDAANIEVTDVAGQVILVNCNNIRVENQDLSNTDVGIELLKTDDSIIANNTVSSNDYGIKLYVSCNNTICDNNVCTNNEHGIDLIYSDSNSITRNNASSNHDCGIILGTSIGNSITGNEARNNTDDGIYLYDSRDNSITGNEVRNNNNDGIYLYDSRNNSFTYNNASNNNGSGIYLISASNNKIYLNNFIDNADESYSSHPNNTWNSTEELVYTYNGSTYKNCLGNYWSNYTDKYPDAKEIDGYGIWNTPYSIYSDNDTYPLVEHYTNYNVTAETSFDTGPSKKPYPAIYGIHNGTITPNRDIEVQKLYTYPCTGTGGHTEYARIWNSSLDVTATWSGYTEEWQHIAFNDPFTLVAGETYNYYIRTGSYPQIHHNGALQTTNGWINCTEFTDANGKIYDDWLPAIRLWS